MIEFSPYVLFRRATLAFGALAGLVPERTWSMLDAAQARADADALLREQVEHELHRIVPRHGPEDRRRLLRLRRAVHNDRPVAAEDVPDVLPPDLRALVDRWCRSTAEREAVVAEAGQVFASELDTGRKALADVALHDGLRRGIQLSNGQTYQEVMAFAADPFDAARKPSRRRRTECTITSFAYRVACKPSPFGAFTEIGAHPFTGPTGPTGPTGLSGRGRGRTGVARISVGLLSWMTQLLHRIDRAEDLVLVSLNSSLVVDGERAMFVRRQIEGVDDGFVEDRVVTARNSGLLRLVATALAGGGLPERELRARLTDAGLATDDAAHTVDELVRVGLCHRGLGIADQELRRSALAGRRLRELGSAAADQCADVFEAVQRVEDEFASAPVERREVLLGRLHAAAHRLAELCGSQPPPPDALRASVYEDLGTFEPSRSWRPEVLAGSRAQLEVMQRLMPLVGGTLTEQLGLHQFVTERFGASDVGLVEVYRAFAELPPAQAGEVMTGARSPYRDAVHAVRRELYAALSGPVADPDQDLVLDQRRLAKLVEALPSCVPPCASAAYRLQFAELHGRPHAVVNAVSGGHGVFYSRFCDLLEPGHGRDWRLGDAVRAHIGRTNPRQTDLTAVLGLNFNLHPRLTPYELLYPGSAARPRAAGVLTMADIVVRANPARPRVDLVSTVDGKPVDLVPLNFLFPGAAPRLYRFLSAFAPTAGYRTGLWDHLERSGFPVPATRPRILLGDLVLDRRSWRLRASDVADLSGLDRYELPAVVRFERWRRANGLPRYTFFRMLPQAAGPVASDPLEAARQWAAQARHARLHKPHFLDSRNPFLLAVLARQLRDGGAGTSVVFTECLPAPNGTVAGGTGAVGTGAVGTGGVEEFVIECNLVDQT